MVTNNTYINAQDDFIVKGNLTVEGNVTQVSTTINENRVAAEEFIINSDGENTTAKITLNSNNTFANLSYIDGGSLVVEPNIQGNVIIGAGQTLTVASGASISGNIFAGNLTGVASEATMFTDLVTVALTGDATGSAQFQGAGNTATITVALDSVNANVDTFGNATTVGTYTVNAKGLVTAASENAIAIPSTQVTDFTSSARGTLTGSNGITYTSGDGIFSLTAILSGSDGTYGSASKIPVFLADTYGRIGSIANVDIAIPSTQVTDFNTVVGAYTIETDQTITADKIFTGTVDLSGATLPGNITFAGNITATNIDTVTQTDSIITDNNIYLNQGGTDRDAMIQVEHTTANVYLNWNESSNRWGFSNDGSADNNMLLATDFVGGAGLTYTSGTTTFDIGQGDGITVNANDIAVDGTVVRTSGNQSLAGIKTFTGAVLLPDSATATNGAIYTDNSSGKAYVYVNGTIKEITPAVDAGDVEDVGSTGLNIYAGSRTSGSTVLHGIKSIDGGTYTNATESGNVITIDGDISAIRGAFSAVDNAGDGTFSYNAATGAFSYSGVSQSQIRGEFSASGSTLSYDSGTGVFTSTADNYASWSFDTDTGSAETVTSGEQVTITGGTGIGVTHSGNAINIVNTSSADISAVTAGTGLDGGGNSGDVTLTANATYIKGLFSAGGDLSYSNGVFSFTNDAGDITGVTAGTNLTGGGTTGAVTLNLDTGNDIDMLGNKVLFGNMYSAEGDLPSASTYHGMFAHVHGTGKGYFAHSGAWKKLLDESSSDTDDLTEGSSNLYHTTARARAAISATGDISYNSSTGVISYTDPAPRTDATIRGLFSATNDLAYNSSTGAFTYTMPNLAVSDFAVAAVQLSTESFADNDTSFMTSAAIQDKILSYGYTTDVGDITGVTAGSGISGGGTSGGVTLNVDLTDTAVFTSTNTASKAVVRDGSGNFAAGTITATATQAQYADLAENYVADAEYEPGTVLVFGGQHEVTTTSDALSTRVAGVVSTNPAHLMNDACEGEHVVAVALRGRVPVKVSGNVNKGDVLITSDIPGVAMVSASPHTVSASQIVGKAIEAKLDAQTGFVEALI
ncbi:hypothetical protein N9C44_01605 [bacterium]|nr:hypothetical protein [bacterium]